MSAGGCRSIVARLDAYADGELSPEHVLEIEAHLADCQSCSARLQFDHAVRKSVRRATYAAAAPSDAFRERIVGSLRAEASRAETESAASAPRATMLSWGNIAPLAVAAAVALLFTATTNEKTGRPSSAPATATAAAAAAPYNVEKLLPELVERHLDRSAPAVTEPALLDDLEPEVGVPVRAPSLSQYGARWEGGSVVPLRNKPAASLRYRLDGHRVTLYVFNAERLPERLQLSNRFRKRVVRNEPVYVTWKRGYSIAAADRRGVGYAVATDLGEDEGAEIVASLR
jgi:anti-sigma factor (TIGR02949 family)